MSATPLTDEQQAALQVYVGPLAWNIYDDLASSDKLDLPETLLVYGDVRLVAAEVLDLLCLSARKQSVSTSGVKSFTIGPIKVERSATGTASGVDADTWAQRAAQLRVSVQRQSSQRRSVSVDVQVGF